MSDIQKLGDDRLDDSPDERPIPPIGVTHVCDFLESPKHYHWKRILKNREETPAMKDGIAFHSLVLEPEKFYANYCTDVELPADRTILKTVDDLKEFITAMGGKPKGRKDELVLQALGYNTNALIYDHWIEEQTRNKEFIPAGKWKMFHEMRDSLLAHKFVKRYLPYGKKEMFVEGVIEDMHVRGRIDWMIDDPALPYIICVDVKKTKSAKFLLFRGDIWNRWLFVQAALYSKLLEMQFGRPVLYVWLACESTGPKIVEAYSANEAVLEAGETAYKGALNRLKECFETDEWPGYTNGMVTNMDLPSYGFDKIAEMDRGEDE